MKYHYTYLIQHKTEDKRYIGVRSSNAHPTEDTDYWGSSKHLPTNIQENHVKIIIKIHHSRKEAVSHEILLHKLNNVAANPSYYNKACQTSTGFDTSGVPIPISIRQKISNTLKGRIFSEEHKSKLSKNLKGKPKTLEHSINCSKAQKLLASLPGYKNPRQGVTLSEETKRKMSESLKRSGSSKSIRNNRFSPWFITDKNITYIYYDKTKEEIALENNLPVATYCDLSTKSKGYLPIKKGKHKGLVIGNISDAIKNQYKIAKPLQKRAWYITYPGSHSVPFYYTTRKEYAEANGINPQAIADALHISSGTKTMKKGPFKGLILGHIT